MRSPPPLPPLAVPSCSKSQSPANMNIHYVFILSRRVFLYSSFAVLLQTAKWNSSAGCGAAKNTSDRAPQSFIPVFFNRMFMYFLIFEFNFQLWLESNTPRSLFLHQSVTRRGIRIHLIRIVTYVQYNVLSLPVSTHPRSLHKII